MNFILLNILGILGILFPTNCNNYNDTIILVSINNNINSTVIANEVTKQLNILIPNNHIKITQYTKPIMLPNSCKYNNRFRADKSIYYLHNTIHANATVIGITHSDISLSIHGYDDYGIRGLAKPRLNTCITSNFRVPSNKYYAFTIIHEYLHTKGLNHCSDKQCIMSDGQNNYKLRNRLCKNCLNILKKK